MDINIKDLTKEQKENLKKQFAEEQTKTIRDIKAWDSYYYIGGNWAIYYNTYEADNDNNNVNNNNTIAMWNWFLTKQEAEKEVEKRKAIVRINNRIDELNDWWIPDWDDHYKYNIYYNNNLYAKCYKCDFTTYRKESHAIKYMQTEEIAEEIIKEYKNDLDIIFDIK